MPAPPSWASAPSTAPDWASAPAAPASAAAPPAAPAQSRLDKAIEGMLSFGKAGPETAAHLLSATVAKPASDIALIATGIPELMKPPEQATTRPLEIREKVRKALTYEPTSRAGQLASEYNPAALVGKGVDWLGGKAEGLVAPPGAGLPRKMAGSAIHEGITDLPALLGVKAGPAAAEAAGRAAQAGARTTMKGALKPTMAAKASGDADIAVQTMLKHGLPISEKGVAALEGISDKLTNAVDTVVARNAGKTIDRLAVSQYLTHALDKFRNTIKQKDSEAQIQKVWDDFLDVNHPSMGVLRDMPVKAAQEMKRKEGSMLKAEYGKRGEPDIEARKAIVHGLKEEIEKALPEVAPINAENSRILKTLPIVERRALMEASRNPIGLAWKATDPVHFAAWLGKHSAQFQSIVAQMLQKAGTGLKQTGPAIQAGGIAASEGIEPPPSKMPRNAQ